MIYYTLIFSTCGIKRKNILKNSMKSWLRTGYDQQHYYPSGISLDSCLVIHRTQLVQCTLHCCFNWRVLRHLISLLKKKNQCHRQLGILKTFNSVQHQGLPRHCWGRLGPWPVLWPWRRASLNTITAR